MELVQYGGSERNVIVRFDDVAMIVSARQAAHHHDPGQAAKRQGPAKDVYMTATGTKPKNPCRRGKVHTCRQRKFTHRVGLFRRPGRAPTRAGFRLDRGAYRVGRGHEGGRLPCDRGQSALSAPAGRQIPAASTDGVYPGPLRIDGYRAAGPVFRLRGKRPRSSQAGGSLAFVTSNAFIWGNPARATTEIEAAITAYIDARNADPKPFR